MPSSHRVMVRLSPELYAQLATRGSHQQPLAAIVRQALVEYLARQPEQPPAAEQPPSNQQQPASHETLATRLTSLESQVEALTVRVEALAAHQQPPAATIPPSSHEQPGSSQEFPAHYGRPGLSPATLQAIVDERARYPDLTMRAFAQHLFDQGIYRGRTTDGREIPADHSRLRRWLRQAQRQG